MKDMDRGFCSIITTSRRNGLRDKKTSQESRKASISHHDSKELEVGHSRTKSFSAGAPLFRKPATAGGPGVTERVFYFLILLTLNHAASAVRPN
jgi:hypothetical protein